MKKTIDAEMIFDKGQGIVIILENKWSRWFDNMERAAQDYFDYLMGENPDSWCGNEPNFMGIMLGSEDLPEEEFRDFDHDEIIIEMHKDESSGWLVIDEFCNELRKLYGLPGSKGEAI